MNAFQQTYAGAKLVLTEQKYILILFVFALFFFALFIFIPVATIPGNSIGFQLSTFRVQDYLLMLFLAVLMGLNFSMNIYVLQKRRRIVNASQSMVSGAGAGFGGTLAAIVGTTTCVSCLASLFGIVGLGIGSVAFVLKYQMLFLLGAITFVVISLYFNARKISKTCSSC